MAKKVKPLLEVSGQIFNDNTSEITDTKCFSESYCHFFTGEEKRYRPEGIIAIGPLMLKWLVEHPEAISIEEFLEDFGMPEMSYYNFVKKFPEFAGYHKNAITMLANRRERFMTFKKYGVNDQHIATVHGRYRKLWRDDQIFKAMLKILAGEGTTEEKANAMKKLEEWRRELQPIPDTEEVRKKLEADERRSKITNEQVSI